MLQIYIYAALTFRPLRVTIKETIEWDLTRAESDQLHDRPIVMAQGKIGLTPEREMELLESWHKTH